MKEGKLSNTGSMSVTNLNFFKGEVEVFLGEKLREGNVAFEVYILVIRACIHGGKIYICES